MVWDVRSSLDVDKDEFNTDKQMISWREIIFYLIK